MRRVHRETVDVLARFGRDGRLEPCVVVLKDCRAFRIDEVLMASEFGPVRHWGCGISRPPDAPALFGAVGAWQDPRAVHDLRGARSEKGPFLARSSRGASPNARLRGFSDARRAYLAKASSFWMHGGDMLPRTGVFPVRGPFGNA